MSTEQFYSALPVLTNFFDITNSQNFVDVPPDWYILVTDVVGSTDAIAKGRYKDINLLGASSIMAVLNAIGHSEVPFIFGGDGASILVPPSLLHPSRQALLATKRMAKEAFNLELRVGAVPVEVVLNAGYNVKVAKVSVSDTYYQASFTGGGLTYATDLVKQDIAGDRYQICPVTITAQADFSGLECRWQDIPSQYGQTITLLVTATQRVTRDQDQIYRNVLETIQAIYGDEQTYHPIVRKYLRLTYNPQKLSVETRIRAKSTRFRDRLVYLLQIIVGNLLGAIFMRFNLKLGDVDWGRYKPDLLAATDYKKFDDMLRMVISGTAAQTETLTQYFEQQFKADNLVYGLHISDRALMTCLVFERNGRHVHFVDGADGGYTLAAKDLKQRLHRKVKNWKTYTRMLGLKSKHDKRLDLSSADSLLRHPDQTL